MGRVFLLLAVCLSANFAAADQILLPQDPRGPRQLSDDYYQNSRDKNLERMRQRREARNPKVSDTDYWQNRRDEELKQLSRQEANLDFGMNMGLGLVGFSEVSGPREDYEIDPPTFFRVFWRVDKNKEKDKLKIWVGARAAFITGWGSYENIPGRFGFSYYGPMVGLGNFNPVEADLKDDSLGIRTGYMWLLGIATASRFGKVGKSVTPPDQDLNNRNEFDPPGIWLEYQYMWLHFRSVELSVFAGVQTGKQKIFTYIGTNFGGWL